MSKHVDLIAIGLLLGGAAFYSGVRRAPLLEAVPAKGIAISQAIHRAMKCPRSVKVISILPSVSVTAD
ncbi:MAG: hypothetical protein JO340_20220 [Acidobacteriaceae bacterium]|nr:hypothetical protein [Acidobacteriaceae bacterium]